MYVLWSCLIFYLCIYFFFFKQKTAYEMRISDWSSDVCSSDLAVADRPSDIRRRPEDIVPADAIDVRDRPGHGDGMAAIVVHHALGDAGRPRCVENVERMARCDRNAGRGLGDRKSTRLNSSH